MAKATLPSTTTRDSKYARLADGLRRQIEAGELKPGDQLPSYAYLSTQFGIRQNTAEKMFSILEQDGLIIREPNRGIFVAVPKRRGATGAIGLFSEPAEAAKHPYHSRLLAGIQDAAHKAHVEIVLLHGQSYIGLEKIDGLLFRQRNSDRLLQRLPIGLPAVSLVFESSMATDVIADDYAGMQSAVKHLLQLGHRRIAYLGGGAQQWTDSTSRRRLGAFKDTLLAAGLKPNRRWIRPLFEPFDNFPARFAETGHRRMRQWLDEDWNDLRCTALLAHNDDVAIGAIDALTETGIRVPEQVSVIGFDDTEVAQAVRPRLTTVTVPLYEIGVRGTQVLLELIASGSATANLSNTIVLPTTLQVRESTAPAP